MNAACPLDTAHVDRLLREAQALHAPATLRQEGTPRIFGDLAVTDLADEGGLVLSWDNGREVPPPPGADVTLSVLVGDRIHTFRTRVLSAAQPHLTVAWPTELMASGSRDALRVAAPDQSPLQAEIRWEGGSCRAELLRLTESGLTLLGGGGEGLQPGVALVVGTVLPGGQPIDLEGHVVVASTGGGAEAGRVEVAFGVLPVEVREALQRFLQARRTDRSELLRTEPTHPRES